MKVEVATGMKMETFALHLPSTGTPLGESETVGASGAPVELHLVLASSAGAAPPSAPATGGDAKADASGPKVDVASIAGVAADQLTDAQLAAVAESCEVGLDGKSEIALNGCSQIRNMSCLAKLTGMPSMQVLDMDMDVDVDMDMDIDVDMDICIQRSEGARDGGTGARGTGARGARGGLGRQKQEELLQTSRGHRTIRSKRSFAVLRHI
jgi:hypothetical protein